MSGMFVQIGFWSQRKFLHDCSFTPIFTKTVQDPRLFATIKWQSSKERKRGLVCISPFSRRSTSSLSEVVWQSMLDIKFPPNPFPALFNSVQAAPVTPVAQYFARTWLMICPLPQKICSAILDSNFVMQKLQSFTFRMSLSSVGSIKLLET